MIGVAAFAHRPWDERAAFVLSEDRLHSVFATIVGVGFIGGVLSVLVLRRSRTALSSTRDVAALVVAVVVPMMMSSSVWGLLQRLMFLTAACWYGSEAWAPNPTPRRLHDARS
jgi:hypothetical protein